MRSLLYFLAAGLFEQPNAERTRRLQRVVAMLRQVRAEPNPWRPLLTQLADHLFLHDDDLTAEHTRLFVLGIPRVAAQPFGSCWLEPERQVMGRTTVEVREMMAAYGLGASGGLLPDHIVSELEFMAWLIANEEIESTAQTQQRLLHDHLARWVPAFTAALRAAEPPNLYRLAAELLDRLIADHLGEPAPEMPILFPPESLKERFE